MSSITTKDAAGKLGITIYRVNQLINDICPECRDDDSKVWDCPRCRGQGRRLPIEGRFGDGQRAPYEIREEDLELVKIRIPGYPKGRKRK